MSLLLSLYTECKVHSVVTCKSVESKQHTPSMGPFKGNHVRTYECVQHGQNVAGPGWDGTSTGSQNRIENEINDAQGAQNRRGLVMHASTRNCIHNLELGEEDNLAEVAQANVLTEVTKDDPDNPPTDNREVVTTIAL
jgi:hypothetical protein